MAKEAKHGVSNRERFLKLQYILKKYTDEEHGVTLNELLDLFYREYEDNVNRATIRADLKELNESGLFEVIENQKGDGLEKFYSHQHRLFEIYELRMLIDAVSAAKFIPKSETNQLVEKIKKLTSINQAEKLKNRMILSENIKSDYKPIKYTIHELHQAISLNRVIHFQYGRFNVKKEFQLSRDGGMYTIHPYALVWNSDFYYLIGKYVDKGDIRHYRVDRMRNVAATEETFLPDSDFDANTYAEKLFFMYAGEESFIELEFNNQLINVVIDRFGRGIHIRPVTEKTFRVSVQGIVSDGLVRWLLTWGSDVKVLKPQSLAERIREEAEKMVEKYR